MNRAWLTFTFLCIALLPGCGPKVPDRTEVQGAMNAGLAAFSEGKFAEAEKAFSAAHLAGGLSPDQVVELVIHRAVCRAHLGDTEGAHADLAVAEQGAPNLDLVLSARAFVLEREGNSAAARETLAKARERNPQVKIFEASGQK